MSDRVVTCSPTLDQVRYSLTTVMNFLDPGSHCDSVAKAWANWVTSDIIEDIEEQDLVPGGYLDEIREVIMAHLTDVAIANACRAASAPGPAPKGDE